MNRGGGKLKMGLSLSKSMAQLIERTHFDECPNPTAIETLPIQTGGHLNP
jgi:hypothetical protein